MKYFFCLCVFLTGAFAPSSVFSQGFELPPVPATLTDPSSRADYLALHYWDRFSFRDTSMISRPEITEQAFADFLSVLPYSGRAEAAFDTLFCRSLPCKDMFYHFVALTDKYLGDRDSPLRDEDLYIAALRALVANPALPEIDKLRPRYLLTIAMKNRPGDLAADFSYSLRSGGTGRLSELQSPYTLLYFNDPDCDECLRVGRELSSSSRLAGFRTSGRLSVLSVCVSPASDGRLSLPFGWIDAIDRNLSPSCRDLYDLSVLPVLYLLDADKRVLLKEASPERIETFLTGQVR